MSYKLFTNEIVFRGHPDKVCDQISGALVDAYQSFANVGGGTFNGKDPTKVDLSGAYKARQLAKKILTLHNCRWVEVQIAYAIGLVRPLSISIKTDKGNIKPLCLWYKESEPKRIIEDLKLKEISYEEQAKWGHFR